MSSSKLNQVLEAVRTLTPNERRQLATFLGQMAEGPAPRTKEDELDELLLRTGVIEAIPPRDMDPAEFRSWEPLVISGKPVSETIVEERR
jgi:hypothetical protein